MKNIDVGQRQQKNFTSPYVGTFWMNWATHEKLNLCAGHINYFGLTFLPLPTKPPTMTFVQGNVDIQRIKATSAPHNIL